MNEGSNKNTYIIMDFTYQLSTQNFTKPLYEIVVANETIPVNETYGEPEKLPAQPVVLTYIDSKGNKKTRVKREIDCTKIPANFNDDYYCTK